MKRFIQSAKPMPLRSSAGNYIYTAGQRKDNNPNSVNTGKGRVSKKRVMQLRYLQSKGIKPVSKDILQWLDSVGKA
mgnify:CR=1 FL=1